MSGDNWGIKEKSENRQESLINKKLKIDRNPGIGKKRREEEEEKRREKREKKKEIKEGWEDCTSLASD